MEKAPNTRAFKRQAQQAHEELFARRREDMRAKMVQVQHEMKAQYASANSLDLVIVMDCTSSMAKWIDQAKVSIINTINTVKTAHAHASVRVGFVAYRDFCDGATRVKTQPLTADIARVKRFISGMTAIGGGDVPEDIPGGLEAALDMDMRAGAKRVILVADAPCHGKEYHTQSFYADDEIFSSQIQASPCIRKQMRTMARRGIDFTFIEIEPEATKVVTTILQREYLSVTPVDGLTRDFRRVLLAEATDAAGFGASIASSANSSLAASKMRSVFVSSRNACRRSEPTSRRMIEVKEEVEDSDDVLWVPPLEIPEIKALDWRELDDLPVIPAVRHSYHFRLGEDVDWARLDLAHSTQETCIKLVPTAFAKGAMRSAHAMFDTTMRKRFVAKCYYGRAAQDAYATIREHLENDVNAQVVAKKLATLFSLLPNEEDGVDFISTSWYEIKNPLAAGVSLTMATFTAEPFIDGEYMKYNNNNGWTSDQDDQSAHAMRDVAQAFSHFTWQKTYGQLMVVDLQGVGSIFTDPQIHSVERDVFGRGNLSEPGMAAFFSTHKCNCVCKRLELPPFYRTDALAAELEPFEIVILHDDKDMTCSCSLCGQIIQMRHSKFVETHRQGQEIFCDECAESVDVQITRPCIVCDKQLQFSPYWYDMKGMQQPTACEKCKFVVLRIKTEPDRKRRQPHGLAVGRSITKTPASFPCCSVGTALRPCPPADSTHKYTHSYDTVNLRTLSLTQYFCVAQSSVDKPLLFTTT